MKRNVALALVVAALLLTAVTPASLAHERKALGSWSVVFGMTPEPVFTGQFYKTTWRFVDAQGNPVRNLKELTVTILYDGKPYGPFVVSEAHGDPGLYETATIFERAGSYRFILNGKTEVAGTDVPFEVEFYKDVLDASVITVGG